jgi:hypothetical protein
METEISCDEYYALNSDLVFRLSENLMENNIKMISTLHNIIMEWDNTYQRILCSTNVLNSILTKFSDSIYVNDSSIIHSLTDLLLVWPNIYHKNIPNYTTLFDDDFFTIWYEAKQKDDERNKKDSHNFNILRMFYIGETMHSQLLKLLLDPNGDHGQGNLFLSLFLEKIGIKEPYEGTWKVTVEEGKIDLLLKRNDPLSIVVIENKSNWARDQPNQLYRYWYKAIYKETNKFDQYYYKQNSSSFKIIYLAHYGKIYEQQTISKPNGYPQKLPEKIPMEINRLTFKEDIFHLVKKCMEHLLPTENYRMLEYLKQYQEICNYL